MSDLANEKIKEKLNAGSEISAKDWEAYVQSAHAKAPSMTPNAFAKYKSDAGLNSYEFLIEKIEVKDGSSIVDLACGDGFLLEVLNKKFGQDFLYTGIDMSPGELNVAKQRFGSDPNVDFREERAQNLSLEDGSVDYVLSHMAFMLMRPVEEVVQEIHRILAPGGKFLAVVGARNVDEGLRNDIHRILIQNLNQEFQNLDKVKMGDRRTFEEEGLQELFGENKFCNLSVEDFSLNVKDSPDAIWRVFQDMYFIDLVAPDVKSKMRDEVVQTCVDVSTGGVAELDFPFKMISVRKKS